MTPKQVPCIGAANTDQVFLPFQNSTIPQKQIYHIRRNKISLDLPASNFNVQITSHHFSATPGQFYNLKLSKLSNSNATLYSDSIRKEHSMISPFFSNATETTGNIKFPSSSQLDQEMYKPPEPSVWRPYQDLTCN